MLLLRGPDPLGASAGLRTNQQHLGFTSAEPCCEQQTPSAGFEEHPVAGTGQPAPSWPAAQGSRAPATQTEVGAAAGRADLG